MDEDEKNVSTSKVFTEEEEVSLLKQITKCRQSLCMCVSCSMNELKNLAYQIVREKKRPYPKSWNKNQQTNSEWLKKFKNRHSDKIAELFLPICKVEFTQALMSEQQFSSKEMFTFGQEQAMLTYIKLIKKNCICKNCIMKKIAVEAYRIAREMGKYYPESWDADKQAGRDWLKSFEERNRDEILKLSPICEAELSQETTNRQRSPLEEIFTLEEELEEIFTMEEERSLLKEVKELAEKGFCDCVSCVLEELKLLAYERAWGQINPYPLLWDTNQCADHVWLNKFVIRHDSELAKIPTVCKINLSRP
ncbi:hypothetical protein DBV15_03838 [Temnothorax longispinosus]|uniref:HTH CENPB-type domain-containing protein n=1 Tax=Temnothorax longispinosus TaxID=300112 RepID=A0A4S2JA09_9HYME|nr:hypothetical protein DBV15_03838 [Temnothorax longispinosus]